MLLVNHIKNKSGLFLFDYIIPALIFFSVQKIWAQNDSTSVYSYEYQLNINNAEFEEIARLPVSHEIAEALYERVTYRGAFQNIYQLREIQGIDQKLLNKLKSLICIEPYRTLNATQEKIEQIYYRLDQWSSNEGVSEYVLTRSQGESPMNNLICDAMVDATSADFSFTNYGGIRSDLEAGPITPRDIFKVLPFGNSLVVLHLCGDFLKELFEDKIAGNRSGLAIGGGQVIYDREGIDGNKIKVFKIAGESIQADNVYRVVTTDYLAEGNSGLVQLIELPESQVDQTGILLRDAVTQYVQKKSPLKIKMDGRWQKH